MLALLARLVAACLAARPAILPAAALPPSPAPFPQWTGA